MSRTDEFQFPELWAITMLDPNSAKSVPFDFADSRDEALSVLAGYHYEAEAAGYRSSMDEARGEVRMPRTPKFPAGATLRIREV